MPIYEYRCTDCGHELEALQKISDPKLTTCPACGKESLTKLVSASAFVLKGSGWYVTDFRDKKSGTNGKSKTGESASESGKKTESDDKTAATESKSEKSTGKTEGASDSKKSASKDSDKTAPKPTKKAAGE